MKQKYKYSQGGDILGGVSQLAPLLNMAVPGLGTGVGAIAGLGAKYFNDQEMKAKQAEAALNNPANYSNQNAFGYADGGMLSGLAQGAGLVTGAPNQVDGNQMNYKGSPIALNHGETLDTNKDRVISANYFNPVTGKKIVDEDKALKRSRGKAENILKNGTDSAAANTIKYTQQQEDALFKMQEMIAQMAGDRNRPQDQQQQMPKQEYYDGGEIDLLPLRNPTLPDSIQSMYNPDYGLGDNGVPLNKSNHYITASLPLGNYKGPLADLLAVRASPNLMSLDVDPYGASLKSALAEHKAGIDSKYAPRQQSPNFWTQSTQGEKIGMLGQGASLLAKGIESFQPLQQQQTRPNTSPISLTQLDPSAILNRNQQSYQSALAQAQGNTSNQNVGYQQSLFANKLAADNQALSQFQGQNAGLKDNYEQRLAQRQDSNNANANQVDDIMARRRGARENMRMGVYGDVAALGMNTGRMMNERLSNQVTSGIQRTMAPDVWANYVKTLSPQMKKYLNIND